MKVILLQEVKNKGGEGDVVEVQRGFAVNYLFPKKYAIEATKGSLIQLEARKHNIEKRETSRLDSADKVLKALNEARIEIPAKVGEEGQLFGSVTNAQIADAVNAQFNLDIDRKKIEHKGAIKTAGEHVVSIALYRDIKAELTIVVVDENASNEPEVVVETDAVADEVETTADGAVEVAHETDGAADAEADESIAQTAPAALNEADTANE